MTDPTYRLEGVVKSRDEPRDFEGPLSLILTLLSKNKIEIRDISISDILDQYLEHIGRLRELDLDVASEFVQMASHLVYIKARMLLAADEAASELEELMSSLERLKSTAAYTAVQAVAPELLRMSERGMSMYLTPGEPMPEFAPYDYRHEPRELLEALAEALKRAAPSVGEERLARVVPGRIAYPVRDKARQLLALLAERGDMSFASLCAMCGSRTEIVATFISVLELCAAGNLSVLRDENGLTVKLIDENAEEILDVIAQ